MDTLFNGTTFSEPLKKAIGKDLTNLHKYYPTLFPLRYENSNGVLILLQGTIPIKINEKPCILPINSSLPNNFPNSPPIVQIPVPKQVRLFTGSILGQDGKVQTEGIIKWVPRQTYLLLFFQQIQTFFSRSPPYSYSDAQIVEQSIPRAPSIKPQYNTTEFEEAAIAQANVLFDSLNSRINECNEKKIEKNLTDHYVSLVNSIAQELEKQVQSSNECSSSLTINYEIPREIESASKIEATQESFKYSISLLKEAFDAKLITIQDYINTTRRLHRQHFENDIYPTLQ